MWTVSRKKIVENGVVECGGSRTMLRRWIFGKRSRRGMGNEGLIEVLRVTARGPRKGGEGLTSGEGSYSFLAGEGGPSSLGDIIE